MPMKPMYGLEPPTSSATGLPMGVEQVARDPSAAYWRSVGVAPGVEQAARAAADMNPDMGPVRPMIYQGGRVNQPLPAAAPAPNSSTPTVPTRPMLPGGPMPAAAAAPMMPARPPLPGADPRGLGANSPLGGYDPRPLSARGATRVGPVRAPGERELRRQARRGNWRAASILYGTSTGQDFEREQAQRREAGTQSRFDQERQDRFQFWQMGQQAQQEREGRADARGDRNWERDTTRRQQEADAERQWRMDQWKREQDAMGDPADVKAVPVPGTDYVVPISGRRSMGIVPGAKPAAPAMTQQEIDAARASGGRVKVTRPGGEEVTFEPPPAAPADRAMQRIPAQPGATANDPGTPERMFDPYTGEIWEVDPTTGQPRRVSGPVRRGAGASGEKTTYNPFAK